jgi:hypothetical protein
VLPDIPYLFDVSEPTHSKNEDVGSGTKDSFIIRFSCSFIDDIWSQIIDLVDKHKTTDSKQNHNKSGKQQSSHCIF